jgi:hypothetical protein
MDAGLAALLGASVATVGTTTAAMIASWSTHRQVRRQAADQRENAQRQRRRDAYDKFLSTCYDAREELSDIWYLIRQTPDEVTIAGQRLANARKLVYAVQRANSVVLAEGPHTVLDAARRAQESLELFYAGLLTFQTELAKGGSWADHNHYCAGQRMRVRKAIECFAEQSGLAIYSEQMPSHPAESPMASASPQDLEWLIENLSRLLGAPKSSLPPEISAMELGLDSLMAVQLCHAGNE